MELVYLPDPMTRLSTWNNYPTWDEINLNNKLRKQQLNHQKEDRTSEKNCSICQQKKKRILSNYIKSKQVDSRNSTSIQEEDEEEEEKTKGVEDRKSS